jgi:hypothetical protein
MNGRVSERNLQEAIVARLRWHGWLVRELSQPQAVRRELIGIPDVVAFKDGCTLLIECKRPRGRMRASQTMFADELRPHLRTTLAYVVASDVDVFARWLRDVEAAAGVVTVREEW